MANSLWTPGQRPQLPPARQDQVGDVIVGIALPGACFYDRKLFNRRDPEPPRGRDQRSELGWPQVFGRRGRDKERPAGRQQAKENRGEDGSDEGSLLTLSARDPEKKHRAKAEKRIEKNDPADTGKDFLGGQRELLELRPQPNDQESLFQNREDDACRQRNQRYGGSNAVTSAG